MSDFACPYCGAKHEYDGDPMGQDKTTEYQCSECDKLFLITCSYSVDYAANKADCLNNGNHVWKDAIRTPYIINRKIKQRCQGGCNREQNRTATEEEIQKELAGLEKYPGLKSITLGN